MALCPLEIVSQVFVHISVHLLHHVRIYTNLSSLLVSCNRFMKFNAGFSFLIMKTDRFCSVLLLPLPSALKLQE